MPAVTPPPGARLSKVVWPYPVVGYFVQRADGVRGLGQVEVGAGLAAAR
jgi:hypothetical protein